MEKHTPNWNEVGPELLEALKNAHQRLCMDVKLAETEHQREDIKAHISEIEAVVAKAEGR